MPNNSRKRAPQYPRLSLTLAGWLFLFGTIMVGTASIKRQTPLMYMMFGGMVGVLHISAILSMRMLTAVSLRRKAPTRVWQNQTIHVAYYLRNHRRRSSCLGLSIEEDLAAKGRRDVDSTIGYCVHLPAGRSFRSGARLAVRRRGRLCLGDLKLSTSFPFGLVRARRRIRGHEDLVVWPARGKLKLQLLRHEAAETSTAAPSRLMGGQDEFFGLREYRQDDNPRWIHWRRSADRAVPLVREMARPTLDVLWVVLDTHRAGPGQFAGYVDQDLEKMLRFAGTLIDQALGRGYEVGLAMAGDQSVVVLPPAGGRGQQGILLDALADAGVNESHPLGDVLSRLGPGAMRQAHVILVTLDRAPTGGGAAASLRSRCRRFTMIPVADMDRLFQDDPHMGTGVTDAPA